MNMAFNFIKGFDKSKLKSTAVSVRNPDGTITIEEKSSSGHFEQIKKCQDNTNEGYVVDMEPDLQVAMIRPHLFVGSQDPARDKNILASNGITHILNCAGLIHFFPEDFTYLRLPVYDIPECEINAYFEQSFQFIENALTCNGKVFVHCNAGLSRAPSIVASYLMKKESIKLDIALKQIKEIRPKIKPNEGFMKQLNIYENHLGVS